LGRISCPSASTQLKDQLDPEIADAAQDLKSALDGDPEPRPKPPLKRGKPAVSAPFLPAEKKPEMPAISEVKKELPPPADPEPKVLASSPGPSGTDSGDHGT
jgi:hypothetical protein